MTGPCSKLWRAVLFVCRAVISTSKRRRLCSEASCYVLPLLKEWLEQLPESPVACLKCFGMLERVIRLRRSTKEIEEVLKSHLAQGALTFTDGTIVCNVSTQTVEFEELSVSLQSSTTPILPQMRLTELLPHERTKIIS